MSGRPARPAARWTRITVRVTPRAGRDAIDGWSLDPPSDARVLRVRVAAAPADGRANAAALRLVAGALGVPVSRLTLVAGARSRTKTVDVERLSGAEVDRRLAAATGEAGGS